MNTRKDVVQSQLLSLVLFILTIVSLTCVPTYAHTMKGEILFYEHCAECHGDKGDGRGAVGIYLEGQRPANLLSERTRARSDQELIEIIRYGIGLEMPSWNEVLSDQQIQYVLEYLRILAPSPYTSHDSIDHVKPLCPVDD